MGVQLPIVWAPVLEVLLVLFISGAAAVALLPPALAATVLIATLLLLAFAYSPDVPMAEAFEHLRNSALSERWCLASSSAAGLGFMAHVRRWRPVASRLATEEPDQAIRRVSIVCLHGTFSSSHEFEEWAKELQHAVHSDDSVKIEVEIVAIDLPGHGLTGPWVQEQSEVQPYSVESDVLFLQDIMASAEMRGKDVVLVGHSIGGAVAAAYAACHPEHVAALILISPWGLRHGANDPCMQHCVWFIKFILSPRWRFLNLWLCLLLVRITPRFLVRYAMRTAIGPGPPKIEAARVRATADRMQALMLCSGNRRTFVSRISNFTMQEKHALQARTLCRTRLAALRCPVQLQWGEADKWLHVSRCAAWADSLAHCMTSDNVVLFPGVGHVVPEQVPLQSAAASWNLVKTIFAGAGADILQQVPAVEKYISERGAGADILQQVPAVEKCISERGVDKLPGVALTRRAIGS